MATPPFLPDETKPADGDIVSQYPAVERTFRDVIETWMLVDHDTAGEHAQVTLPERGSDPSAVANTGFLYTKDDSTDTELFYRDDSGNVVQLTLDGAPGAAFPATTKMLFVQTAAPTGWVKDTDQNDRLLRVVSGTPSSGGSWTISGLTDSGHTHGKGSIAAGNSPAHGTGRNSGGIAVAQQPHTHTITGTTASSTATIASTGAWRPLYLDVIKATKS